MALLPFILLLLPHFGAIEVDGLRLKNVTVPRYGVKGGSAVFTCDFHLDSDPFLVLKWYKDGNEFFRYSPHGNPHILTFPLNGVVVDIMMSNLNQLVLKNISLTSSGKYKCEVSADRPSFQTLHQTGEMIVIAPPQGDPEFVGIPPFASVGDLIKGNCSSHPSKPAAGLLLYINDEKAELSDVVEYLPTRDADGLESSVLGINFPIEPRHFRSGAMELKCTATLGNGYWVRKKIVFEPTYQRKDKTSLEHSTGQKRISAGCSRPFVSLFLWMLWASGVV